MWNKWIKNSQKVIFEPFSKLTGLNGITPVAAKKTIPGYYKDLKYFYGTTEQKFWAATRPDGTGVRNLTIKNCVPFLDVYLSGYSLLLSHDVFVDTSSGEPNFSWDGGGELIAGHDPSQVSPEIFSNEFWKSAFKFGNLWKVTPPSGYSILYTHPLNRTDLPFYTLSGVVDDDTFDSPVNLPFLLKKDFHGLIEAGTPIAQLIPIKRETWEHEVVSYDEEATNIAKEKTNTRLLRYYKKTFWQRKDYN